MVQRNKTVSNLVLTALLTALTLLCTFLLKIPVGPDCYIHLGDAVIFISVMILPRRYACFAGPVGAGLADLLVGFAFWVPWTFFIKLFVVLVYGFFMDRAKSAKEKAALSRSEKTAKRIFGIPKIEFIGFLIACVIGVLSYFGAEWILCGQWVPAAICIPLNCIQMGVAVVISVLVSNALARTGYRKDMLYIR